MNTPGKQRGQQPKKRNDMDNRHENGLNKTLMYLLVIAVTASLLNMALLSAIAFGKNDVKRRVAELEMQVQAISSEPSGK